VERRTDDERFAKRGDPDADALIVRSATKVTTELLEQAKKMRAVAARAWVSTTST